MKTALDIVADETHVVRHDVEALRGKLTHFSGELQKFSSDQQQIVLDLQKIRSSQKTFQDRASKIAEKLRNCKTVLATYSS